eukprot:COSAG02_NODE_55187_length_292_cov_0.533679_1_plen_24_part_01
MTGAAAAIASTRRASGVLFGGDVP